MLPGASKIAQHSFRGDPDTQMAWTHMYLVSSVTKDIWLRGHEVGQGVPIAHGRVGPSAMRGRAEIGHRFAKLEVNVEPLEQPSMYLNCQVDTFSRR